jgi:hypothetical protein
VNLVVFGDAFRQELNFWWSDLPKVGVVLVVVQSRGVRRSGGRLQELQLRIFGCSAAPGGVALGCAQYLPKTTELWSGDGWLFALWPKGQRQVRESRLIAQSYQWLHRPKRTLAAAAGDAVIDAFLCRYQQNSCGGRFLQCPGQAAGAGKHLNP